MSLFGFSLRPRRAKSANTAKDRLQLLLAHERVSGSEPADFLPQLQNDIIAVIRKYVNVGDDDVDIRMERGDELSSLEINIEMPASASEKSEKSEKAETADKPKK
ncbi:MULTISPECIES: cell division topological specificity factor MinE [Salipiger]|jgi:cell division topological specificity factor|uniref:Cell division topological specificity factor n=1 Tax=Salipiger profundus TaxID=1229727 RepID=A0A1U7D6A6_9RHOB|nr:MULTISPECIES: cell division topological specificity factor MinE [Salipiger]APX23642.1 cell division topological specificity factor [Salipiger profundus]GGA16893.1 cell division topological specificity factor [Salipiger profundus]SFD32978.1 cell division topological specificity factor MinE [Salipiger profundus]